MPDLLKKYQNQFLLLLVISITIIVYNKSLHFDFINWDDDRNVYENQDIRSLSSNNIHKIFGTAYLNMYQPLTTLSYAVEYKFKGLDPKIYHFHNLILHLINITLVFLFVYMLIRQSLMSALIAFLFALHPMHVESVAWVTERKDLLYTCFYLLSLISYIKYLRKDKNLLWYFISLFLFLLSLLSKSAAITLPLILFLIDYKEDRSFKTLVITEKIPFILLSVIFSVISVFSQHLVGPANEISLKYHFYERLILGSYAFFFYIIKSIFPFSLSVLHPFPDKVSGFLPLSYYLSALGILIFLGFFIWLFIRKKFTDDFSKTFVFGILFFCSTIGLVLFMPVGSALTAERYTYVPYIGLFISLIYLARIIPLKKITYENAWLSYPLYKNRNYFFITILTAWLIFLTVTTFYRLDTWKNSLNIWNDAVRMNPRNAPLAYQNRGVTKSHMNDYAGAITDYTAAIKQHPKFKDAYYFRGIARFFTNDFINSIRDFDSTLMLESNNVNAYINRGRSKASLGDIEGGISDFSTAIKLNPTDYLPYYNRAILFSIQGKKSFAFDDFSSAIIHDPTNASAFYARGLLSAETGNKFQACSDFRQAANLGLEAAKTKLLSFCN